MSISLLVTFGAIALVFVIGLGLAFLFQERSIKTEQQRFEAAHPGNAKIIEVGTSIIGKTGERISAALRFEVTPKSGQVYKARSPWVIEPDHIGQIQVGQSVSVKIDSKRKNIIFPDVAWARYDWTREHEIEPIYED